MSTHEHETPSESTAASQQGEAAHVTPHVTPNVTPSDARANDAPLPQVASTTSSHEPQAPVGADQHGSQGPRDPHQHGPHVPRGSRRKQQEAQATPSEVASEPVAGGAEGSERSSPAAEAPQQPKTPKKKAPKQAQPTAPSVAAARDPHAAPDVSVIVPITTGNGRVREVVEALGAELERLRLVGEFILVFDGVRGAAWREAEELVRERQHSVHPIAFQQAFGESVCLSAGFERARAKVIVTSPQYVQIDPFELGTMLAALERGAHFVTPWRHPRIDPVLNRVQSALFNWVMRKIIHVQFHDLNCYFRVLRREVLEDAAIYGDMYRFLPAIAARQGFTVVELKVRHLKEWGGSGFFGLGVYARRVLDILGVVFLSKFTLKPLRFFGTIGGALSFVGGLLCAAIVAQSFWYRTLAPDGDLVGGPILSRPLFLFGFLVFVLGVQIIGFGLVGEIIIYTQARNLREYRIERIWESSTVADRSESPEHGTEARDGEHARQNEHAQRGEHTRRNDARAANDERSEPT